MDKGLDSGYARSKKQISAYGVEANHDRVNSRLAVPGLCRMDLSMLLWWKLQESLRYCTLCCCKKLFIERHYSCSTCIDAHLVNFQIDDQINFVSYQIDHQFFLQ